MVRTVSATEAKTQILALLDDVASGDEIVITKHGRIVARLTGAAGPDNLRGTAVRIAASSCEEHELFGTGVEWNAS